MWSIRLFWCRAYSQADSMSNSTKARRQATNVCHTSRVPISHFSIGSTGRSSLRRPLHVTWTTCVSATTKPLVGRRTNRAWASASTSLATRRVSSRLMATRTRQLKCSPRLWTLSFDAATHGASMCAVRPTTGALHPMRCKRSTRSWLS